MKFSIVASLLIVCLTAVLAVMQGQKISGLDEERSKLQERAIALGVPLEDEIVAKSNASASLSASVGDSAGGRQGSQSSGTEPIAKSSHEATAKAFAKELFNFATKMRTWREAGEEPPKDAKKQMFAFLNQFLELDPEVMPMLIDEIRANTKFEGREKQEIIAFCFMALSQSSPQTALNLYVNSKDIIGQERMAERMVTMSLGSWASQDPAAALDWLAKNADKLPEEAATWPSPMPSKPSPPSR